MIHKLAEAGQYSRPEVTNYVESVLRERRNAVGTYWLNRVTPLEDISLSGTRLQFRNLAVERTFIAAPPHGYRFHVENLDKKRLNANRIAELVEIPSLA